MIRRLIFPIALFALLSACGQDLPGHDEVSKTWHKYYSTSKWETGPLYGGTAILLNETAGYWLKEGRVYTCNGVAMECSPQAPTSPPSISQALVEQAVHGQAPAMPPHFALTYTDFLQPLIPVLQQSGFKRQNDLSYSSPNAQFDMEETGGQLTKVDFGFRAEKGQMKGPLHAMIAILKTLDPGLSEQDVLGVIQRLITESVKHLGQPQTLRGNAALFGMTATRSDGKRYAKLTATPLQKE